MGLSHLVANHTTLANHARRCLPDTGSIFANHSNYNIVVPASHSLTSDKFPSEILNIVTDIITEPKFDGFLPDTRLSPDSFWPVPYRLYWRKWRRMNDLA
jgi:hypothetical protein